jgi:SWI/SNF-related matrix-associated actin-dependent regulator 1 of chromatin subfamily A
MGKSFLSFAKRYCAAYHNGYGWVSDGASNLAELRVQLHGVMLRRTKDEVLDLPPKLRSWVPVQVPEGTGRRDTRRVLERLLEGAREKRRREEDAAYAGSRAAGSAAVGQSGAAGDARPAKDVPDKRGARVQLLAALTRAREAIANAKARTTIEFVEGVVAQGIKVIVFSSFEGPILEVAEHFGEQAVVLTGSTPASKRQGLVDRFQNDPEARVFVANLIAGGQGINLTAAQQVVFNDLDWVPANHWQAEDRAYRIGQTGTVNVTYFCAEGTIDEFVASVLRAKASLIEAVVEGRGALPVDADLLAELEALVRSLSPELAEGPTGEDPVDRLLREAVLAARIREEASGEPARKLLRSLPTDSILALARVLSGPVLTRYRAKSASKPGTFYVLDVDGADVTCSCAGFEYRGACSHARALKEALANGTPLPEGTELMRDV